MQHLPQGVKDQEGCFVYEVIEGSSIGVRNAPDVSDKSRTDMQFGGGQLVSIDLIRPSRISGSNNGPFLRLSDGSGWLFEQKYGEKCMRRIPVETGLWVVYVDNYPAGQSLRSHPVDRSSVKVKGVVYLPMQKLYCDRKVHHKGVNYFRVQGTEGWVFDVRPQEDETNRYMLLDESMVKTGLFAFRSLARIAIRNRPVVGDDSRTIWSVSENQIVVVDVVRESPHKHGNGPFLRLADGCGWLFEYKYKEKLMEEIKVEPGKWVFLVGNGVAGIGLRRHPIDSLKLLTGVTYKMGTRLVCDCRVKCPTGVNFFRVEGTGGWVFDKRGDSRMMELIESSSPRSILEAQAHRTGSEWSPDFVRGVAAACVGVEEISYNPTSRVISFRTVQGVRVNVYYTTRTIGTALDHPLQGKTQLFRRNCSDEELVTIMNNPRVHTDKGYQRKRARTSLESTYGAGIVVDGEEEVRSALMECDEEMTKLSKRRQQLLSSIRSFDMERYNEATATNQKREERKAEDDLLVQAMEAEKERKAEVERKRIQEATCLQCHRVFSSPQARAQHCRDAHGGMCDYCNRFFTSQHALNQHRDALGHW